MICQNQRKSRNLKRAINQRKAEVARRQATPGNIRKLKRPGKAIKTKPKRHAKIRPNLSRMTRNLLLALVLLMMSV